MQMHCDRTPLSPLLFYEVKARLAGSRGFNAEAPRGPAPATTDGIRWTFPAAEEASRHHSRHTKGTKASPDLAEMKVRRGQYSRRGGPVDRSGPSSDRCEVM
ncbi:hypothetical protein EYF80_010302 [Liparis tanakae]|uniref:Uncharacterized protein n=1 Tax=Liparis tanakae TaxID=230148 RepID=A0A4Z2IP99_9TELE|nr:hypothetical protein EYF80_010302 [Liparis tanakae]